MADVAYNQPSASPTPKVAAVASMGVVLTAIVTLLAQFNIVIPAEVPNAVVVLIGSIYTLFTFAAGYFKRDKKPSEAVPIIQQNSVQTDSVKG